MNSLGYSKVAQTAIAAVSHLALRWKGDPASLSTAGQIAEARNLTRPLVAKVLTALAGAGIVRGEAGRSGGYALDRPPESITFFDVVNVFDPVRERPFCPFGPGWCGEHNPCAVHDELESLHQKVDAFLKETHFGILELDEEG